MAPMTLDRNSGPWLDRHTHEWSEAGLISERQADAIRHFEHLDEPAPAQRLTLPVEAATYLGSLLALGGGAVLVVQRWDDLTIVGRLSVALAVAAMGFLAGWWSMRLGEAGTERLGSFLWTVGTGGVAMMIAVVLEHFDVSTVWIITLSIGVPVLAIGQGLWRNLDRPLQMLTALTGLIVTCVGVVDLLDVEVEPWQTGAVIWPAAAVVGILAALDRVHPRLIALVVAFAAAFEGSLLLMTLNDHVGAGLAALTSAVVVVYALRQHVVALLVLGLLGFLVGVAILIGTLFSGTVAGLVAATLGLAIVVVAVMRAMRSTVT